MKIFTCLIAQSDQVWALCGGVSERFGEVAHAKFKEQVTPYIDPFSLSSSLFSLYCSILACLLSHLHMHTQGVNKDLLERAERRLTQVRSK